MANAPGPGSQVESFGLDGTAEEIIPVRIKVSKYLGTSVPGRS